MKELIELIKIGKNDLLEEKLNANPSLAGIKTEQGISLLQFASYCRNNIAVEILKKHKQNLDVFEAACIGDLESMNQLLDETPESLNSFSSDGFTLLGLASFFGHLSLVRLLLEKGLNPNIAANNPFKVTPLHSACAISNIDIVELLIIYGADVNARQMHGVTPLHSAAYNGQLNLSKFLIGNGADFNAKMDNGQTPLFVAKEKNFQEIADLITKHGGR